MVDVSAKNDTKRTAVAGATVLLGPGAFAALAAGSNAKGNVLVTARLAGIMAAKRTSELIPLCHPIGLTHVAVELHERPEAHALDITASATCTAATGVEMEAMTAASVAALTVYDMCKAACVGAPPWAAASMTPCPWPIHAMSDSHVFRHKGIVISNIRLISKSGGKSGHWQASTDAEIS